MDAVHTLTLFEAQLSPPIKAFFTVTCFENEAHVHCTNTLPYRVGCTIYSSVMITEGDTTR